MALRREAVFLCGRGEPGIDTLGEEARDEEGGDVAEVEGDSGDEG